MTAHAWERETPKASFSWTCSRCGSVVVADAAPRDGADGFVWCFFHADDAQPAGDERSKVLADCDAEQVRRVVDS